MGNKVTNTSTSFRFSTDILRRLGEELNPTIDQSVLELVKNSFDANATECNVVLRNADRPGGTIQISDDGDGMDAEGIINGWLVLGRSGRSPEQRTRLNRIPAGSKGLGRLAALRLGGVASLQSWPQGKVDREYRLTIDWSKYETARIVEDVPLAVEEKTVESRDSAGTVITIENLRGAVSRPEVSRLARSLILLADPFGDDPEGFKPVLHAPEFSDLEKLVTARYFQDAEFHLLATLDGNAAAHAVVTDWKGKTLFSAKHNEISTAPKHPPYGSPEAQFDLWAFILNKDTFSTRTSTIDEVKQWLGHFGGVHVYQNGLRVSPYGNPGNDWLDMNLRRARSPEERPSTNNSIGRVSVFETQGKLTQKTDRSGFIEGDAFLELKRFANDALEWMSRCRMKLAEKRREEGDRGGTAMKLSNADIGNLVTAVDHAIAHSREIIESALPVTTDIDKEAVLEERENLKIFLPLRKRLRAYERQQLKKHFPRGFPKGRRSR